MCIAVVALHLRVVQQLFDGEILEVQVVLHSSRRVLEACAKAAVLMSWLAFHDSTNPSAQPRGSLPKKFVGYLLLMRIMKDSGPGFGRNSLEGRYLMTKAFGANHRARRAFQQLN